MEKTCTSFLVTATTSWIISSPGSGGGLADAIAGSTYSGSEALTFPRMMPDVTVARRKSITLVTMSRYGTRLISPDSSSSSSISSSRRLCAIRALPRT